LAGPGDARRNFRPLTPVFLGVEALEIPFLGVRPKLAKSLLYGLRSGKKKRGGGKGALFPPLRIEGGKRWKAGAQNKARSR